MWAEIVVGTTGLDIKGIGFGCMSLEITIPSCLVLDPNLHPLYIPNIHNPNLLLSRSLPTILLQSTQAGWFSAQPGRRLPPPSDSSSFSPTTSSTLSDPPQTPLPLLPPPSQAQPSSPVLASRATPGVPRRTGRRWSRWFTVPVVAPTTSRGRARLKWSAGPS